MDFFKDQSESLARNKAAAYKQYKAQFEESLEAGDSELFHDLVKRQLVTQELYNEHGKTVNQMLKTTLESFQ
ncbi:type III secretion protein [Pseudomonas grimontii]|uniref:type III secretion protein n=1 Tax=Pseudomonas grimontii TaxID=129847 RepID=UPI002168A0E3|nr:type III secretion protein [Pseudomonas grimontii]MCS3511786.1 hypothetical protein [Pseudomonas grimontii]